MVGKTVQERFWCRVDKSGDCWLWTAGLDGYGYGQLFVKRNDRSGPMKAHRLSYQWLRGDIPIGMTLDHLCRNRACVNPDHLEVVTRGENVRRGERTTRTVCPLGHVYTPENTVIQSKGTWRMRSCRTCREISGLMRTKRFRRITSRLGIEVLLRKLEATTDEELRGRGCGNR